MTLRFVKQLRATLWPSDLDAMLPRARITALSNSSTIRNWVATGEIGKGKAGSYSPILDSSIEPESIGPSVLVEKIERGEQEEYYNQTEETAGGGWWNGY